jgi:hypothetical protein
MATTTFRKASDTRESPELPTEGRKKLTSMMAAASNVGVYAPGAGAPLPVQYGPNLGPVNNPPLTASQSSKILDASKFPAKLSKYKQQFIRAMVDVSAKLPSNERRKFDVLLNLASNICSIESMSNSFDNLESRISDLQELTGITEEEREQFINNLFLTGAIFLVNGFDVTDKSHFIFDKDGTIIGIIPQALKRKKLCVEKVNADNLRREQSTQFKTFLKTQSDPYKGSQQGTGKTRKHKKQSKKTRKHKGRRH